MADSHAIATRPGIVRAETHADASARSVLGILRHLLGRPSEWGFAVRLWDGTVVRPQGAQAPVFTLVLKRPGALRRMLLPPTELALGEAYLRGDFDVEGDMEQALARCEDLPSRLRSARDLAWLLARLRSLPGDDLPVQAGGRERSPMHLTGRLHSRSRDAEAVRYHYDVGNSFYSLWLDTRMVYSCAYFKTGSEDLDAAQGAKLEHICRKLRLQPGERLLDIGCGWGGLVLYAVQHYGVEALGITLSEPQAELARGRIAQAGLSDRCRVEVLDYRDLPEGTEFDKVVSVGMFEHVGRAMLPTYFAEAYRLTRPGGLFLNHGIVDTSPHKAGPAEWVNRTLWHEGEFMQKYVFPDGELETPGEVIGHAEHAGFETRDVESLREHYALTLRHWVRRLEAHHDEAARTVGEPTYRVWRLYMSGCAHAFDTGNMGIVQVLMSKTEPGGRAHLPMTRADIYMDQ